MKQYLVLENDAKFRTVEMEHDISLEQMQEIVGGLIEPVYIQLFAERNIDIWVNEEGKILNLQPSCFVTNGKETVDILVGNILFTKSDNDGGTTPLTNDDIQFIQDNMTMVSRVFTYQDYVMLSTYDIKI